MFGEKLKRKYALTEKGLRNTKVGAAWTVVVNLIMMAGIPILSELSARWRSLRKMRPPHFTRKNAPKMAKNLDCAY